jgi:hypothetical protein
VIACEESSNESPLEKEVLEEEIKPPTKITHIFVLPQEEIVTPYQSLEAVMDCKNFSNLQHLIRVTCYVFRFIRNVKCRAKENVDVLPANRILTTEEIVNAKNRWIRTVQLSEFAKKFENISARIVLNYIRQFGLYIDQWGILRCKGRIGNANIPSETANPVLLPTHHHLTTLVIKEVHAKTMHGGVASTLTAIRDNYWIPRGREIVKSVVRRCIVCTRYNAKPFPLFTPPSLPHSRVDDGPPWTNTGVDCAGPIFVLRRNAADKGSTEKVYLCLFTCASTRAVHLELVQDCSAEQFLMAFRRFVGRRGLPRVMMSDNAKNFKTSA